MIIIFAYKVSPSKMSTKLAKIGQFYKLLKAFPENYTGQTQSTKLCLLCFFLFLETFYLQKSIMFIIYYAFIMFIRSIFDEL